MSDIRCLDKWEEDGQRFLCQHPKGHTGPHESGDWEWWDDKELKIAPPLLLRYRIRNELLRGFEQNTTTAEKIARFIESGAATPGGSDAMPVEEKDAKPEADAAKQRSKSQ